MFSCHGWMKPGPLWLWLFLPVSGITPGIPTQQRECVEERGGAGVWRTYVTTCVICWPSVTPSGLAGHSPSSFQSLKYRTGTHLLGWLQVGVQLWKITAGSLCDALTKVEWWHLRFHYLFLLLHRLCIYCVFKNVIQVSLFQWKRASFVGFVFLLQADLFLK